MSGIKFSKFYKLFPFLFFILLSILIIAVWFKNGLYYGGAEIGLSPFYNPARSFDLQKYVWWDGVAPGMLIPQFVTGVPFYLILSILELLFSPIITQALFFFFLLFLMGYGMYLFCLSIVGLERRKYAFIAGLFYMLNSYVMVEVWHRFLYTGFLLAASLPIFALFWRRWVTKGSINFLALLLLINLIFSYMFGNLTSVMVIWILFSMITIIHIFFPWHGRKNSAQIFLRFFVGFSFFIIINLWWLLPTIQISASVLPEQHSLEDNISTLVNISKQTILPFTLQYANPFYLFYTQELGSEYLSFFFRVLPWIPAVIIFIGVISGLKNKIFAGYSLFYLLAILIAKGAASPFGYPYIWGFINIFILGVIRNPFEKLGILIPFFGSILFIAGLEVLLLTLKKSGKFISRSLLLIILLSIFIYSLPMFTGRVFNKPDHSLLVKVPKSYKQADNWLRLQKDAQGNILQLPFPDRDVVTYNWESGYHGVEINENLFTSLPSITRNVGIKRVDDTLKSLSFIFGKPFSENQNQILRSLQSLNVRYIVLHKDTQWEDSVTYGKDTRLNNPNLIEDTLNNLNFLEKSITFGDLIIYKLKDNFYKDKIVLSDNNDLIYPGESNILQTLKFSKNNNQITPIEKELDQKIIPNSSNIIIFPERFLSTWEPSKKTLEEIVNKSLLNSNDQSLPFTQLSKVKQAFFSQTGELLSETLITKVLEAGNNLIKLTQNKINGNLALNGDILETYNNLIDDIFKKDFNGSSLQKVSDSLLTKVFTLHLYILEKFSESADPNDKLLAIKSYDKLNNYLISNYILPSFRLDKNIIDGEAQRRVNRFSIPIRQNYELLITDPNSLFLYPDILSKLDVQLDGNSLPIKTSKEEDAINLGQIELDKGIHEITYKVIPSINLTPDWNKFILLGNATKTDNTLRLEATPQGGAAAKTRLNAISGGDSYELSFEAINTSPLNEFYIQIMEDTQDQTNPYDCSKISCYNIKSNPQVSDWQNFSLIISPLSLATRNVTFQILLPVITNNYSASSVVQIRNIKLNRIMDNHLILRKKLNEKEISTALANEVAQIKKINPVLYEGRVKIEKSAFLFFKETFNPNWVLTLIKDNKSEIINKHYLGNLYGNAYFIESPGEYNFKLEFKPQEVVNNGIIFSIFGWLGIICMIIYSEVRKGK